MQFNYYVVPTVTTAATDLGCKLRPEQEEVIVCFKKGVQTVRRVTIIQLLVSYPVAYSVGGEIHLENLAALLCIIHVAVYNSK